MRLKIKDIKLDIKKILGRIYLMLDSQFLPSITGTSSWKSINGTPLPPLPIVWRYTYNLLPQKGFWRLYRGVWYKRVDRCRRRAQSASILERHDWGDFCHRLGPFSGAKNDDFNDAVKNIDNTDMWQGAAIATHMMAKADLKPLEKVKCTMFSFLFLSTSY